MDTNTFYAITAATCFTLVGLWWSVVKSKPEWLVNETTRRLAGGLYHRRRCRDRFFQQADPGDADGHPPRGVQQEQLVRSAVVRAGPVLRPLPRDRPGHRPFAAAAGSFAAQRLDPDLPYAGLGVYDGNKGKILTLAKVLTSSYSYLGCATFARVFNTYPAHGYTSSSWRLLCRSPQSGSLLAMTDKKD